jgi:hypothetical protein
MRLLKIGAATPPGVGRERGSAGPSRTVNSAIGFAMEGPPRSLRLLQLSSIGTTENPPCVVDLEAIAVIMAREHRARLTNAI